MSKNVGSIRRSQIISTFGPGAMVDLPVAQRARALLARAR